MLRYTVIQQLLSTSSLVVLPQTHPRQVEDTMQIFLRDKCQPSIPHLSRGYRVRGQATTSIDVQNYPILNIPHYEYINASVKRKEIIM